MRDAAEPLPAAVHKRNALLGRHGKFVTGLREERNRVRSPIASTYAIIAAFQYCRGWTWRANRAVKPSRWRSGRTNIASKDRYLFLWAISAPTRDGCRIISTTPREHSFPLRTGGRGF